MEAADGEKTKETRPATESKTDEKATAAAADVPKELAMRPLPTYRIEPPDILHIEVTSKGAKESENQPLKRTDEKTPSDGVENKSGDAGIVAGAIKAEANAQADNKANSITINSGESLNNASSGTLTISGGGLYTGTTSLGGGTYIYRGDAKPGVNLVFSNAPPSTDNLTVAATRCGIRGADSATGQYLVGPDGTINMRRYGIIQVAGMTVSELKAALEKHLANYMEAPEVWVDVSGYNSKVFYIITDGSGYGDNVRRIPICGNETVLDAVAAVGGLSQMSSKRIWLSRPSPTNPKNGAVLPVDYEAITQRGATETNYQIMPGDRIFIAGDRVTALNNNLGKATAPVERVMGLISLGAATIESVERLLFKQENNKQE